MKSCLDVQSVRFEAIKSTYIDNTPQDHIDFKCFKGVLVTSGLCSDESITPVHIQIFFKQLPFDIFHHGLYWGFNDPKIQIVYLPNFIQTNYGRLKQLFNEV